MEARCGFCKKLLTAKHSGQFFPEADSYICIACQKKHISEIEAIKSGGGISNEAIQDYELLSAA